MSTTTTRHCDRCEAEIVKKDYTIVEMNKIQVGKEASVDLCRNCTFALGQFMDGAEQRASNLCLARTFAGENCKRERFHKGDHVYTSPSDGASIAWSDRRK
jgi:hypothetical protein